MNKILGNPYKMIDDSDVERNRVVELFKRDLRKDIDVKGPMYQELLRIAKLLTTSDRKITLECWCCPKACHADSLVIAILDIIEELV